MRRPVLDGAPYLRNAIASATPFAAGKIGSIEMLGLCSSLKRQQAKRDKRPPPGYKPYLYQTLHVNAGVFPQSSEVYDEFGRVFLDAVNRCDLLVAWDIAGEATILRRYARSATLVRFHTVEPFFTKEPWTAALKGKRVLVISPFVASIKVQYARRETLWDNCDILPEFELLTLRAPLSAGIAEPEDADWFQALERMKSEMQSLDYNVALIGAGAFSLPLAVFAKEQGKVGIHLGGSLQVLFGVLGERWKRDPRYNGFIKESWRRPTAAETPAKQHLVENACYW